jgi:hypothetical protein
MHGRGLRIGEALAVNLRCRINGGKTLRAREQVNPAAQLRPDLRGHQPDPAHGDGPATAQVGKSGR